MFRLNGYDPDSERTLQFYCKIEDNDGAVMCNFCLSDDGLFYYPKGAHILTEGEHETENIGYTYISHENLNKFFTILKDVEGFDDESEFDINVDENRIIISIKNEGDGKEDEEKDEKCDDFVKEDVEVYRDLSSEVIYPAKKVFSAIEINLDYLQKKLDEGYRSLIYRFTSEWVRDNAFDKMGTI